MWREEKLGSNEGGMERENREKGRMGIGMGFQDQVWKETGEKYRGSGN